METKTNRNNCKLITGLFNQTVNLFQDESSGAGGVKDNKRQQITKTTIENTSPLGAGGKGDTPSVDSSGNIISQEKLRELLYPKKPKLSYMKNNP